MSSKFASTLGIVCFAILMFWLFVSMVELSLEEFPPEGSTIIQLPLTPESLHEPKTYAWPDPEVVCLTKNIFFEARNQSEEGMRKVGYVTLNRVLSSNYPNTVCSVVYEPNQFSWTSQINEEEFVLNKIDHEAWNDSLRISLEVLNEGVPIGSLGVFDYHADYICPDICKTDIPRLAIGNHVFYYNEGITR